MSDDRFLTQTETLTENGESAASAPPEKQIPLSPDAEKQEHEKAILYKEVFRQEWLAQFSWLCFDDKTGYVVNIMNLT